MTLYQFGQMPYGPFPFIECDTEKNRRVFVLLDDGEQVVVAYCTTNPLEHSVSLGRCDEKVSNLAAWRWEVIQKERLHVSKGVVSPQHWAKEIIDLVALCAKAKIYKGYSEQILLECRRQREFLLAKAAKMAKH